MASVMYLTENFYTTNPILLVKWFLKLLNIFFPFHSPSSPHRWATFSLFSIPMGLFRFCLFICCFFKDSTCKWTNPHLLVKWLLNTLRSALVTYQTSPAVKDRCPDLGQGGVGELLPFRCPSDDFQCLPPPWSGRKAILYLLLYPTAQGQNP